MNDTPSGSVGWGWWTSEGNTVAHVAPAYKDGEIIPPHTLSPHCVCVPRKEISKNGVTMWIHEQVN